MKQASLSIACGFIGGAIVATLVLSFVALAGRLGDTGTDYLGFWDIAIVGLGLIYGGPTGIFLVLLMRIVLFKLTPEQFLKVGLQSGLVALIGGMAGGIGNPFYAAGICVIAFLVSMLFIGFRVMIK